MASERFVKLKTILPQEALVDIAPIMDKISRYDLDTKPGMEALKKALAPYKDDIESKGIEPLYFALYLTVMANEADPGDLGNLEIKLVRR